MEKEKQKNLKFPDGFYWGAATSSHQVEGNNHNDWSQWEKENAQRLAKEAKNYWQKWQREKFPEMFEPENYISGKACDHYNRYEEDFDIAKSLGHNAHRFSIEWSRVEPEEGKFDEKEIEHYRQVIWALKKRGIEPFVTLWHWTLPYWVAEKGGWEKRKTIKYFERYVKKIVSEFSDDVKFWITLNEPAIYSSLGAIKGTQPPGSKSIFKAAKIKTNLINAHKLAYNVIHSISNSALVGVGNSANFFIPHKNKIYNKILIKIISYLEGGFFKKIRKDIDYVAFQYYRSIETGFRFGGSFLGIIENNLDSDGERTDLDWKIYPEGMYHFLKDLQRYNLPIYITENGLADARDEKRGKFIKDHLYWIHKAIKDGVNVRGYFHWSLIDNFEFVEIRGFWPRFGLVEINYQTMERRIRPSALEYAKICKSNELINKISN